MNFMTFHTLGIVTPTDEAIFFRGVGLNHQPDKVWWGLATWKIWRMSKRSVAMRIFQNGGSPVVTMCFNTSRHGLVTSSD